MKYLIKEKEFWESVISFALLPVIGFILYGVAIW